MNDTLRPDNADLEEKASRQSIQHMSSGKANPDTQWINGLRGLAALIVFNYHYLFAFTDSIQVGYGHDETHRQIASLPMFRLLADGGTAVSIFFVLSGYVCSIKALTFMSGGEPEKGLSCLASSAFRRFFRLYLPVYCITLVWVLMARLGAYEPVRPIFESNQITVSEAQLERFPTTYEQFYFWFWEMWTLSDPWRVVASYPEHDPHLWAIQFEFRNSLYIYMALLASAAWKRHVRMAFLIVLGLVQFFLGRWEGPLFFFGAALAQNDLIRRTNTPASSHHAAGMLLSNVQNISQKSPRGTSRWFIPKFVRASLYVLALYPMSYPISGINKPSPGYMWMNRLLSELPARRQDKFPKTIGVLLFVYLLTNDMREFGSSSRWHRLFSSRVAQHLGSIIFGFYLVHGNVFHIFGYGVPHWIWSFTGNGNWLSYIVGLTSGWIISLAISLYAAAFFTREIDPRCARLVGWVERWCAE